MKRNRVGWLYHALVTLPDRLYPFKARVQGHWVRGVRAYNQAVHKEFRLYGPGHYGFKLDLYRQVFHLAGSLLVLYVSTLIAFRFFGSDAALIVLLLLATLFITYQEFFLQRREYRQLWRKGVADWLTWCVPIGLYFFIHFT